MTENSARLLPLMVTTNSLPTDHEATKDPDGTWNILGVPIFAEIPAKTRGATPLVSRNWLEAAVARDRARRAEGYSAPLHVHHHGSPGGGRPERAGQIALREVRQVRYDGSEIGVVFADFEKVPDAVYQRIKRGALPYRSVEILDMKANEIASCALLDSEVPFFRFPNLTVSIERPNLRFSAPARVQGSPVTACVKSGHTRGYLFHAQGVTLMDDDSVKSETAETPAAAPEALVEAPSDEAVETAAERMFALVSALADKVEAFETKLDELAQMSRPDITPPSPVMGDEVNVTPAADTPALAADARLHGRLMALEEKLAQMDAEKETAARFSAAIFKLDGYQLSEKSKATLRHFAALGQEHLDTVVGTFEAALPKFPAPTVEDAASGSGQPDPDEVAAYSADAKKHARARALAGQFESLQASGLGCSLAEFIEINLNRAPAALAPKE